MLKLPVIPLWLDGNCGIRFDLEPRYQATRDFFEM
jgi:hypothetical protein